VFAVTAASEAFVHYGQIKQLQADIPSDFLAVVSYDVVHFNA